MRFPLVAAILTVLLAGCAGSANQTPTASSMSEAGADDPATTRDADAQSPTNGPPNATLTASDLTGAAPLTITFTINASDPDGNELKWFFDADGDKTTDANGTQFPATADFTYNVPGEFVANLTVSDGSQNSSATVTLNITEVATPSISQSFTASYTFGVEGCVSWAAYDTAARDPAAPAGSTVNGTTRVQFNVNAATLTLPYTAVFTFDQGYLFLEVAFYDAGNALVASDIVDAPAFGGATMTGTVPAGAVKGVLFACGGPTSSSVTYMA